jgi:plasmid stability protein
MDMLIRNLPDDVHAALMRRAEARDMSLRAYVVEVLSEHVGRPTMQQWLARVRALPPIQSELTGADWVRLGLEDDDYDDRD